jgi:hypothetical protein
MYSVIKGWFYDDNMISKTFKYKIMSHNEYMLYYDGSYSSVYSAPTIQQCKDFLKDVYYFQTILNKKNETHKQKVSTSKGKKSLSTGSTI